MLDRASLEFCLADAFHPGCEMTWPMRHHTLYMAPFRIAHAVEGYIEPQYGPILDMDVMAGLLPYGPLGPQVPGGVTRWMAVPWQTDTASCRSGYVKKYDPYLPTFWPARVPNQVLAEENYNIVMDDNQTAGQAAGGIRATCRLECAPEPQGQLSRADQSHDQHLWRNGRDRTSPRPR